MGRMLHPALNKTGTHVVLETEEEPFPGRDEMGLKLQMLGWVGGTKYIAFAVGRGPDRAKLSQRERLRLMSMLAGDPSGGRGTAEPVDWYVDNQVGGPLGQALVNTCDTMKRWWLGGARTGEEDLRAQWVGTDGQGGSTRDLIWLGWKTGQPWGQGPAGPRVSAERRLVIRATAWMEEVAVVNSLIWHLSWLRTT